jgi:hypothetical protein
MNQGRHMSTEFNPSSGILRRINGFLENKEISRREETACFERCDEKLAPYGLFIIKAYRGGFPYDKAQIFVGRSTLIGFPPGDFFELESKTPGDGTLTTEKKAEKLFEEIILWYGLNVAEESIRNAPKKDPFEEDLKVLRNMR